MAYLRPSHRRPEAEAGLETCQLCGLLVEQDRLIVADVDGLRGMAVCDTHRIEREMRFAPSFREMQEEQGGPPYFPEAGTREEPIGGEFWYQDTGGRLLEDGVTLRILEDGINYRNLEG